MYSVQGYCPVCGQKQLTFLPDGYILCSYAACPNRTAVTSILTHNRETKHIVLVEEEGFTIKHPLVERVNGDLFSCTLTAKVSGYKAGKPGIYRVHGSESDHWSDIALEKLN